MSVLAPPPSPIVDPEALIEEARQRHRRRRRRVAVALLALAAAVALVLALRGRSTPAIVRVDGGPTVNVAAFAGHGRLAFVSGRSVWVLSGRSLRAITTPRHPLQPVFSPDGRWLAFVDTATTPAYVPGSGNQIGQLWLARGDGSDAHPVRGLAHAFISGWSAAGDGLAVVAGPVSTHIPFEAETTVRVVTSSGVRALLRARSVRGAVWSPDGRALAVVTETARLHDTLASYPVDGAPPTVWGRFDPHTRLNGMNQILVDPVGWWRHFGIGVWVYGDGMTHNNDQTPLDVIRAPGTKPRFFADALSDGTTRVVAAGRRWLAIVADVSHGVNGGRVVWDKKELQICIPDGTCRAIPHPRGTVTLDPAWFGGRVAYVEAPDLHNAGWPQSLLRRWYAGHRLHVLGARTRSLRGVSVPIWSADGKSLLYVKGDAIWLLPQLYGKPVRIATPLFRGAWPSYYGQMAWPAQFAWWSP